MRGKGGWAQRLKPLFLWSKGLLGSVTDRVPSVLAGSVAPEVGVAKSKTAGD